MTRTKKSAKNIMKLTFQYLFSLGWAAALSWALVILYPIAQRNETAVKAQMRRDFFQKILPVFDNEPWKETLKNGDRVFYVARNRAALPSTYQPISPILDVTGLETNSGKQTQVAGFAFVMSSTESNPPIKFLIGMDLDGNRIGTQPLNKNLSAVITSDLLKEAKDLFLAHRDLLMFQLEPEGDSAHASL
ncbi:MAG: hypothetical protein EXS63_03915 [Candidatus Omnitrophica bacterium]|nr:hypothetical protein [Candidatus Omnitrophota bacterium]